MYYIKIFIVKWATLAKFKFHDCKKYKISFKEHTKQKKNFSSKSFKPLSNNS